ncbi:MAG: hypothetical protein AB7K09_16455 [Planctomycetota bacterium]
MMRFGKYDSPLLLDAVACLIARDERSDAKQLAARAWLRAAELTASPLDAKAYLTDARDVLHMQTNVNLDDVKAELAVELDEANTWFAGLCANEQAWIASGADVDARFAATYPDEPTTDYRQEKLSPAAWAIYGILAALVVIVGLILVWWLRRRKRRHLLAR